MMPINLVDKYGGGHLVATPRPSDGIGRALRTAFAPQQLPAEFATLLREIDEATAIVGSEVQPRP